MSGVTKVPVGTYQDVESNVTRSILELYNIGFLRAAFGNNDVPMKFAQLSNDPSASQASFNGLLDMMKPLVPEILDSAYVCRLSDETIGALLNGMVDNGVVIPTENLWGQGANTFFPVRSSNLNVGQMQNGSFVQYSAQGGNQYGGINQTVHRY